MGQVTAPFFMATRKSAAEAELQKAEQEYAKLHPLAAQGNDVSPITRGELRIILEDLLSQIGKPVAPKPAPTQQPAPQLDTSGKDQFLAMGRDSMLQFAQLNNIDVSAVEQLPDDGLAEFIAANMNLKGA